MSSCWIRIGKLFNQNTKSFVYYYRESLIPSCRGYSTNGANTEPVAALDDKIKADKLKPDEHQQHVMKSLQKLYEKIQAYTPPEIKSANFLSSLFGSKSSKLNRTPKGLYIYGSVGGGKTTLMDIFYDCCTSVSLNKKQIGCDSKRRSCNYKLKNFFLRFRLIKRKEFISIHL